MKKLILNLAMIAIIIIGGFSLMKTKSAEAKLPRVTPSASCTETEPGGGKIVLKGACCLVVEGGGCYCSSSTEAC
jgi:cytochrome c biogenesis factor